MNRFSRWWRALVDKLAGITLVGVLVVVLALLLVIFLVVACFEPKWILTFLGVSEKYDVLKFLGIGMGGVLLALQAAASHARAKAMEDAAKEQTKANLNTEKGLRQERLKNAIEHLGHESDSVRLGGAYELFHLAQDTEELRQTVLDILCAHIRRTTGESNYREKHESKPSEEIQSLLTLLFIQEHEVFKGLHVNLRGSWLSGAYLPGAHLEKADLTRVQLKRAILRKAWLQGANLDEAQLHRANLIEAHLQEAGLPNAHLQWATLEGAKLQGAILAGARLQGADLSWAHLHGAIFFDMAAGGAELQGAILRQTQLHEAKLDRAQLQGVRSQPGAFDTFARPLHNILIGRS